MMRMNGLKKILRYLKYTMDYCFEFGREARTVGMQCESDVSWDKIKNAKYWNGDLMYWHSNNKV